METARRMWTEFIKLIPNGAWRCPTSGYWLALAYIVEKTMAYRNPIVGIKNHSPSTGTIPIKPRRRLAITPGTRMNTFLLRDLSDKNPPNGPPTMLAKRRSEDNKPAVPNGSPLTSWRNLGRNWAAVNVPPHKPSTPNAITQMFRLLRTGLIEL